MNEQALRFRFGIFVLGALILLAVLIILFGGFPNYFKRTDNFTVEFASAQGITPGTPVRRSGVRIGEVRGIALDNDTGKVRVAIRIDSNYPLRKADRPTVVMGLLGGDTSIAFVPPENEEGADKSLVPPGSTLKGATPADAGALMQKAGDLVGPATEALVEVKKVFQRLDKMAPMLEDTLKDFRAIGKIAGQVGPELHKTSEEIRALIKTTRDAVPDIKRTNDDIQVAVKQWTEVGKRTDSLLKNNEDKIVKSIERIEDTLKKVGDVFNDENQKNFRDTLKNVKNSSDKFESITKDTGELVKESRVTVKQVGDSLKRADDAISDLQKALKPLGEKGPTMLKNFEESADNLSKTMKDLRELMQVVARSDGTVQKLLGDPSLYNNLNDSAVMVTRILPRLDRVLRDVEIFADKLARHPELIGIGGVVRPSSGLKEAPFRIYP